MKRPPPRYSEFCRHWLNNRCTLEYSCPFVHGDLEYDPPVTGRHPRSRPKPQTCRRWLRNECNRGYACFYTHGDLEYDSPTQAAPEDSPTAVAYLATSSLFVLTTQFRIHISRIRRKTLRLCAVLASKMFVIIYCSKIYSQRRLYSNFHPH